LQKEVEQLRSGAETPEPVDGLEMPDMQAASADAEDAYASDAMPVEFKEAENSADQYGQGGDYDEASDDTDAAVFRLDSGEEKRGGRKGLLAGVVMVVLAAAGAGWWFAGSPTVSLPEVFLPMDKMLPGQAQTGAKQQNAEVVHEDASNGAPLKAVTAPPAVEPATATPQPVAEKVPAPKPDAEPARSTPVAQAEAMPEGQPVGTFRASLSGGGAGPTMVELRADSFEMGSGSTSQNFDERPRHSVNLPRFAISKHEVTFDQYDRFARSSGRRRPADAGWGRGTRPVVNVSWDDAVAYIRWLSKQSGHDYRLPTEAEWEFAARSGSFKRYWWGNKIEADKANCFDCGGDWAGKSTAPVGSFSATEFGLHDMNGNAREWVQDCYMPNYKSAPEDGSAVDSGGCARRVIRGGGYGSTSKKLRSSARDKGAAGSAMDDLGFRVVREF